MKIGKNFNQSIEKNLYNALHKTSCEKSSLCITFAITSTSSSFV